MITKLQVIILILSVLDLTATYLYINSYHNKFPTLDYTALEGNPIIKFSMKAFGLGKGMLIGGIVVFVLLGIIVFNISDGWQKFICGAISMMLMYHWLNFMQLAKLQPIS